MAVIPSESGDASSPAGQQDDFGPWLRLTPLSLHLLCVRAVLTAFAREIYQWCCVELRSVAKALTELNSGSTSSQDLGKLLSDGIPMFKDNPRYQNDPRFLKLWIVYVINLLSDDYSVSLSESIELFHAIIVCISNLVGQFPLDLDVFLLPTLGWANCSKSTLLFASTHHVRIFHQMWCFLHFAIVSWILSKTSKASLERWRKVKYVLAIHSFTSCTRYILNQKGNYRKHLGFTKLASQGRSLFWCACVLHIFSLNVLWFF